MKWAHLDETYSWIPYKEPPNKSLVKTFPSHFALIPNQLFDELQAAWDNLYKVVDKIDKYAGKEPK